VAGWPTVSLKPSNSCWGTLPDFLFVLATLDNHSPNFAVHGRSSLTGETEMSKLSHGLFRTTRDAEQFSETPPLPYDRQQEVSSRRTPLTHASRPLVLESALEGGSNRFGGSYLSSQRYFSTANAVCSA
jgi:hypothetical protein